MLKLCKINACPNGTLGLHLSRAPWDPYPWVSGVIENSSAYLAGIRIGDTILEYNGMDVLGWKIFELANKIHNHWDCGGKFVNFLIWRNKLDHQYQQNDSASNINQQSLQKFATCLQNIAQLLECPVCLEVIKPPGWQCCNGHVLCNGCRCRTIKCPICRVPLGPRGRCLLSDKLFTLLAESFPCDGVRNNNKNIRCPEDNHKIKRATFKTSSTITTSSDRNLLMDKPTSQNDCSNGICSGQSISLTTIPKDDQNINKKQIISIKIKSPQQILSVPLTLQSTEPTPTIYSPSSVVTILNNTFSSSSISVPVISKSSSPLATKSTTTTNITSSSATTTLNQKQSTKEYSRLYKNYHCPTGKSCNFQENDENSKIYNIINNFPSTITTTITTALQRNNRNNIYNDENINQNIQWDILTHLRRVHQLFICQYYGNFGEIFQIDLIKQNKSIFCISIDTKFLKNSYTKTDYQIENFVKFKHQNNLENDSLYLTVEDINSIPNNDTFLPNLSNIQSNDDNLSDVTSINSVNSSYSINNRNIKFSDTTELFFIAKIPYSEDNKNIISNLSTTTATPINNNIKIISRKLSLTNDKYRNDNIFDNSGFNNVADINRNIENISLNTSTLKDFCPSTTSININDMISSSDLVVSCRNYATSSSSLPSRLTSGYIVEKCAIFIWYCGNECNVKNFKAFIKCNGKFEQTIIPIHSITKSWDIIRCRKEFIEFNIIDSDENIFEIIIDSIEQV